MIRPTNISKIPLEWKTAISALRAKGFNAILAGGCLRDLFCGKPAKDIDLFVLFTTQLPNAWELAKALGWGANDYRRKNYAQFSPVYQIDFVVENTSLKPPYQIIGVKDIQYAEALIGNFDYGLCQIGFDGERLLYTPAFEKDFINQTFTLTHPYAYDHSIERYKTWTREKYKNWPFVPSGLVLREQLIRNYKTGEKPRDKLAC